MGLKQMVLNDQLGKTYNCSCPQPLVTKGFREGIGKFDLLASVLVLISLGWLLLGVDYGLVPLCALSPDPPSIDPKYPQIGHIDPRLFRGIWGIRYPPNFQLTIFKQRLSPTQESFFSVQPD